jgi:hypothetical protein
MIWKSNQMGQTKQMTEIFLERMRSPEIGAAIESGVTTIIVPCGAVEQHGPISPFLWMPSMVLAWELK